MNPLIQCKTTILPLLIAGVLAGFGLLPKADAVVPAPDGGYPGFNTAEGQNALFSLTTGQGNTAVGWLSLRALTQGSFNTAIGAGTLLANTGDQNTATGAGALLSNTTGTANTANGAFALFSNTGNQNTANGYQALRNNTTGDFNTANGYQALGNNTTGIYNTATGNGALSSNIYGDGNTANGFNSLFNNTTGNDNTALGDGAGYNITGSGNICIGAFVSGVDGVSNTTWIKNVYASGATARQVYVNSDNKIGTLSSSRRYKEEIKPMDTASETLFALKPVTFRYKKEIDRSRALSFGLIAEEVAHISPDLITRDEKGQPQTVRYEAIHVMLLNEFLKEHKKVEEQQASIAELKSTVAQQQKGMEVLTAQLKEQAAQIQKVSAQVEVSKFATGRIRRGGPAPKVVLNNP